MIITCKNCRTNYHIAAGSHIEGRSLRCSNCKHQWFHKGKVFVNKVKYDTLYLTAIKPQKSKFRIFKWWIFSIPTILFAILIAVSVVFFQNFWSKHVPAMIPYYESFAAYSTKDCVLHSVHALKTESGFIINGAVENRSTVEKKIPALLVKIVCQSDLKSEKFLIPEQKGHLASQEKYFFSVPVSPSGVIKHVSVEIMDGLEVLFYKLFKQ